MRFLIDQDVYAVTIRFLSGLGHDVVTAAPLGQDFLRRTEFIPFFHFFRPVRARSETGGERTE
jgi:hypothetical protein